MHSHTVSLGDCANMVGSGNSTGDRGFLVAVGETLASEVGRATLRNLNDDRRFDVTADHSEWPSLSDGNYRLATSERTVQPPGKRLRLRKTCSSKKREISSEIGKSVKYWVNAPEPVIRAKSSSVNQSALQKSTLTGMANYEGNISTMNAIGG